MRNLRFSKKIPYIVCGRLVTQHARCHKEYYSPRGQAVSTRHITLQEDKPSLRVTSTCARSANFATANDFAFSKCLSGLELAHFHEISAYEHPTGAPMQTLSSFKLFTQPIDRAEVLHAPSYCLSGRRKNTLGENELVRS